MAKKKSILSRNNPWQRLMAAARSSRNELDKARAFRNMCLSKMSAHLIGPKSANDRVPFNLMEMFLTIHRRQIIARPPRASVRSRDKTLRSSAYEFQIALNEELDDACLFDAVKMMVLEALVGLGVLKVGYDGDGNYVCPVSLDNWVHDTQAERWEEWQWCGDYFTVDAEEALDETPAKGGAKDRMAKAATDMPSRVSDIGSTNGWVTKYSGAPLVRKVIPMWQFWLTDDRTMVTMVDQNTSAPVDEVQFGKDDLPPYHLLAYQWMPGSTIPLPPASEINDLHDLANLLIVKLRNQANDSKQNVMYRPSMSKAADELRRASNGEYIASDDPSGTKTVKTIEIDASMIALLERTEQWWSLAGGNVLTLGGLSPQSRTVGQDQMLLQSANLRVADMQQTTYDVVQRVVNHVASLMFKGDSVRNIYKPVPGHSQYGVNVKWDASRRKGNFADYDVDVAPSSMSHATPGMQLEALANVFDRFIAPYLPMIQAQGLTPDFNGVMQMIAGLSDFPEIGSILVPGQQPQDGQSPDREMIGGLSPNTKRTYERTSGSPQQAERESNATLRSLTQLASSSQE